MQQQLADYRLFWNEFRRTFHDTGAILPSGRRLARALTHFVREGVSNGAAPRQILEVGSGTGAVTREILSALGANDQLTLVELNERFANRLRDRLRREPRWQAVSDRVEIMQASVEDLPESNRFDVIISGLPLNNFSLDLVERLVSKMKRLLAADGTISFFEYIAIRRAKAAFSAHDERTRLNSIGQLLEQLLAEREIRRDRVWANVPPAWVHHLR
ncbi:MAG: class I SAM-dependent methyltransferase [Pirellulales bacterium]